MRMSNMNNNNQQTPATITLKAGMNLFHTTLRKVEHPTRRLDFYFEGILDESGNINTESVYNKEKAEAYLNLALNEVLHDRERPTYYRISSAYTYDANGNESVELIFTLEKNIRLLDIRHVNFPCHDEIISSMPPDCDGYIYSSDSYEIYIANNSQFVSPLFTINDDLLPEEDVDLLPEEDVDLINPKLLNHLENYIISQCIV